MFLANTIWNDYFSSCFIIAWPSHFRCRRGRHCRQVGRWEEMGREYHLRANTPPRPVLRLQPIDVDRRRGQKIAMAVAAGHQRCRSLSTGLGRHRRETQSSEQSDLSTASWSSSWRGVVPGPSSTLSTAPNLAIASLVIVAGTDIALLIRSHLVVGTIISIREGAGGPARLRRRPQRLPSSRRVRPSGLTLSRISRSRIAAYLSARWRIISVLACMMKCTTHFEVEASLGLWNDAFQNGSAWRRSNSSGSRCIFRAAR